MAKSRFAIPLAFAATLVAATPALAQDDSDIMANYRATFQLPRDIDCPRSVGDEVVVCARRRDDEIQPGRLPLPVEAPPGARVAGEAPSQVTEMKAGQERCSTVGRNQSCSGGLPVFAIIATVAKAVKAAVEPDE
jgi:hypothetical protein